jgi:hypothetical protein
MVVSIYSLRKVYSGDIVVCLEGQQDPWFLEILSKFNCIGREIPKSDQYALCVKPTLHKYVEDYEAVMFLDADTLVLKNIDKYFDYIKEHGFVTGNFSNWNTKGGHISARIRAWAKATPELIEPALNFGTAINTGVNGWLTGNPALELWNKTCQRGYALECTTRIVDEIACQLMLPHCRHFIVGVEWGCSPNMGQYNQDTVIMHYHGHKHAGQYDGCKFWKQTYHEMRDKGIIDDAHKSFCDSSVALYLVNSGDISDVSVTLTTGVNQRYLPHLKKNYPLWMQMPTLAKLPTIMFVHSDCINDPFFKTLDQNKVKIVEWKFPAATSMREEMLSAFVFGIAKHVETKYWIKLDCDCTPKGTTVIIPPEAWQSTLTAKGWGYTKMKSDPEAKKHWLVTLDDWADGLKDFAGTKRLFPDKIEGNRYGHERICTFFAIEKTAWTKHLASMCKRTGGRLPIPSQDTLTWYGIKRLGGGRKITTANFKRFFQP